MKRKRFSVEQIVAVVKQAELGLPVADLIRQVGISEQTFYRWKKEYAGLEPAQARELKQLADENTRLKAGGGVEPGQGGAAGRAGKKIPRPALMKDVVVYVTACHGYSERRACALTRQARSTQRKPSRRNPYTAIRLRMHEIAQVRVRYGYRRFHVLLKREGWRVGRNLVYRLYREEGLVLRRWRPRRRKAVVNRAARYRATRVNDAWSADFVHDQLSNGQSFRALTVIDVYSREALAIEVGQRLRGEHVVAVLNRLVQKHGAPRCLFADNGAEFTGQLVDLWAYHHGVRIDFSRRGKPTDNAFVETFNGTLRDECLNLHWFDDLTQAAALIEAWRRDYNESRPHMALNNLSPAEYVTQSGTSSDITGFSAAQN